MKAARVALPLLAGFAVVAAMCLCSVHARGQVPVARDGMLDLSAWERDIGGAFEIVGQWEFYWDRLLTDVRIEGGAEAFELVEAPGEWNYYESERGALPGQGCATYRLRVTGVRTGVRYGVRIQNMASAYRLYADDELIAQNGSFGDDAGAPVSAYRPQLAGFKSSASDFDLILQVSNNAYAVGGMWEPIIFGTYEQVSGFDGALSNVGMISFGSLAAVCLFFLVFFAAQRREKDGLILAGIGALMMMRLSIYGSAVATMLFPGMPIAGFGWIDYLTLTWIQFLLYYFVYSAYAGLARRWQIIALLAYASGVSLLVVLLPFGIISRFYGIMNMILLVVIAAVTIQLARAAWRGLAGSPVLLGGMGFIFLFILYGIFFEDWSMGYYLLTATAVDYMLLFILQCVVVAQRYNRAQKLEIAHLKGQIRPHFIHNALTCIISLSRTEPGRARELLLDFSSYLRGFYDYEQDEMISFAQELDLVKAYATLEQARFGKKIRVEYDIESPDFLLPPLILQPLVENAIVHGLREKENGGTVLVYVRRIKNGRVCVGVRDDGVGMVTGTGEERRGVGIENINRRLAKLYRTQLVFTRPEDGGCEVRMEIPWEGTGDAARVYR